MTKVITYGTFDLFHEGHYNLLKKAKALGDWLIVGVTTDSFDLQRGKLNTCNNVMERIEAVKATGLADQIIIEEYRGQKIDDIHHYGVDIFAIGSDWTGYFDYLKEFCQVVYLPRTEGISSTQLRDERPTVEIGIIGTGSIARRFVKEAGFVASNSITAAYNPDKKECKAFCEEFGLKPAASSEALFGKCNAVYIASPHYTHFEYAKAALEAEAKELFKIAKEKGLVLMMAHKTAYCPAFGHLVTLLQSGAIGEIVDIKAAATTLTDGKDAKMDSALFGGSMNENGCFPLLPIFRLLGTDYKNCYFLSKYKDGVDIFTKGIIFTDSASGTKGYAYVPAPWWKTSYFELRYEDQNQNKKYFYPFDGEGLRYEIKEFVSAILANGYFYSKLPVKEILAMSRIQEEFINGNKVRILK